MTALTLASCGSSDSDGATTRVSEPAPATRSSSADDVATDATEPESTDNASTDLEPIDDTSSDAERGAGTVDETLERSDLDCSAEALGEDEESFFIGAHYVVDGALGAVCYGDGDPVLTEAWSTLAAITPPLQLTDLGLFGSFESGETGDEVTLAFVNTIDDDGTVFQMSVNLATYEADPNEALLTMAHEFSHVFTALPTQIDRSAEAADSCETYDNDEGCYTPDSLMWQWIERFWGNGLIDEIDPSEEASGSAGQDRCDLDPSFLGAYAASSPEEDFAESFSAFVFQLETQTAEQQAKLDWMAQQPGLAEFRDRAVAAGIGPLENNFDPCG